MRFMAGQCVARSRAFLSPSRMAAECAVNEANSNLPIHRMCPSRCSSSPAKTASIASSAPRAHAAVSRGAGRTRATTVLRGTGHIGVADQARGVRRARAARSLTDAAASSARTLPMAERDLLREISGTRRPGRSKPCWTCRRASHARRAVFAHPHPLYGGTMHTKAVYQSPKALARIGVAVLRFNFRGVGRSAGTHRRRARRDGRLSRRARFRGGTDSGHAALGRRLLVRIVGRVERRPGRPAGAAAARRRAAGQSIRFRSRAVQSAKATFLIHGEEDELISITTSGSSTPRCHEPKELVVIDDAESPVRRKDVRGRRGQSRSLLGGLGIMKDAVIVSAVRTAVGKAPEGHAQRDAARRHGVGRHSPKRSARAPGLVRGRCRRRDPRVRDAGRRAGPECRAHRQPARRRADRAPRRSRSTASARRGSRRSRTAPSESCSGSAQVVVAGGTESMSMVPMGGNKVSPNPALVDTYPDVYLSTGPRRRKPRARCRNLARGNRTSLRYEATSARLRPSTAGRFSGRNRSR